MTSFNIKNHGLLNELTTLNPTFTWNTLDRFDSYIITVYKNDKEIINLTLDKPEFIFNDYLDLDTNYRIKVYGMVSKYEEEISFKTINYNPIKQKITVDDPYKTNMVIQRDVTNTITGKSTPNECVVVNVNNDNYFGLADESGKFEIEIGKYPASFTPVDIKISNGYNLVCTLNNVLFGDVYLFAGQSNMQYSAKYTDYENIDITNAIDSNVRFFSQDVTPSVTKLENTINSKWFTLDQSNYDYFSGIALMSGSMLGKALQRQVPIGIVTAYQGNTNIVDWMGEEYYQGNYETKHMYYNGMIYPIRHTKLSGVVWYQGCNNSAQGGDYEELLLDLFDNYRDLFNSKDMPFFVIGLCCYDGDKGNNYDFSYVRESQAKACDKDSNAYFISTCDDGDPTYIHPKAKRYICERISKSIQSVLYQKDYLSEGPSYKDHTVNNNVVTINLNNAEGLYAKGDINNLYLAGSDGKYYLANQASIVGETIVASSDKVQNPVYIKYGFGKSPFVNIFNKDNFAIVPFRTDDRNTNIDLLEYNDLDKYSFHPEGSKMNISFNNNNLKIEKTKDGKTYGSVRLDYYGMIAYRPEGFTFPLVGTNSGASISFRIIEGSYEIWAYKVIDDFIGEKSFNISASDFVCVYNKQDNNLDTQKVNYIEIMVETSDSCSFEVKEARFIHIDKTAPLSFNISNVSETEENIIITAGKSTFAEKYKLVVTDSFKENANIIYQEENNEPSFTFNKNSLNSSIPYYIYVNAINSLGTTDAKNNGYVFYLKDDSKLIVCNFDFENQTSLDAYISTSMDVNSGLTIELVDDGVKIISSGAGWQQFIFKLDTGSGAGMKKLEFQADFSNYHGSVVLQLADTSWNVYSYTLDISKTTSGKYIIDFSNFLNGSTPFTTQNLMWVMFNFNDNVGNGYIIFDNCILTK